MIVTYAPEDGGAPQSWEFDPSKVRASRAEMIEKRAGANWETWLLQVEQGNMRARRVLLWHLMSMPHPTLRFEDVPDFFAGELVVKHTARELVEIRERVTKAGLPDEQLVQVLAVIDAELADAPGLAEAVADKAAAEGKAPSPSGGSATSGRSPKSSASARGSSASA